MLTDPQILSARNHMGIPASGIPNSDFTMGVRAYDPDLPYFAQVGLFEARVRGLTPTEEAYLVGSPIAQVMLTGTPGDTLQTLPSVALTATSLAGAVPLATYQAVPSDLATGDLLFAIVEDLVAAINAANTPYTAALGPHSLGNPLTAPQASFTVTALQQQAFQLGITAQHVGAYVTSQGTLPSLARTFQDTPPVTVYGLLPILDYLQARIAASGDFAAFKGAGKVEFDTNELAKRSSVYAWYRQRLADFFGIALNPLGTARRGGGGAVA